jgi:RTX calcium-binding nonapeptide repeat (4 copies)
MRVVFVSLSCACLLASVAGSVALANTSHAGWPAIDGVLLMNKTDSARPLDARPGQDPFDGTDRLYSCDAIHLRGACHRRFVPHFDMAATPPQYGFVMSSQPGHNELLGGHGSDTIHAGPWGDVIWGDYKPSGQPTSQVDHLYGGPGNDFIYASHGQNIIDTGGGNDVVHAHFGYGSITCHSPNTIVYLSHTSRPGYQLHGCRRISYKTDGY